jgi:hypothetical protein
MKKVIYILTALVMLTTSCKDNDVNIFDKTADERAAEAIADLKAKLTAPSNGWRVKYRPEETSGSFWVLMQFDSEGRVTIKSDLSADDGAYHEQTVTYRIDSSLGLELIIESYSFFAYLFEQNQASFEAEYEFLYANETPDGELVFQSKSDRGAKTILVFEPAEAGDEDLLGMEVAENLDIMAKDIERFSSSYKLIYDNKDIILYLSMDEFTRILTISTASKKSNTATTKEIDFTTPYVIEGNDIVFDEELSGTFVGVPITISSITLDALGDGTLMACGAPIDIHTYTGETSANDDVVLETSLLDANGKRFVENSYMSAPIQYIFDNGVSQGAKVAEDIQGAAAFQIYYNYDLGSGPDLNGIGFVIQNNDGTTTFALKEYTATFTDNNMVFTFQPGFRIFGNPDTDANLDNINFYLDKLTQGDQTFVYEYSEGIYEFYNPCSGWSFVFVVPN